jgi:predicted dehydrogenase
MTTTRSEFPPSRSSCTRRRFLAHTGAATVSATLLNSALVRGAPAGGKIALGLVGCGGRGRWLARLFRKHGGYEVAAVADYFPERSARAGAEFGVPEGRRFSGLNGYLRLLEQPVDAVAIISPPYFHPTQAAAAVAAGKHVYLAKPIAVDVPGCLSVARSGQDATAAGRVFLVDFQTRASKDYQEVVRRVRAGQIGEVICGEAGYHCGPTFTRLKDVLRGRERDPETRLRAWGVDRVLSGDVITEQNIHALDVACWFLDDAPVAARGTGGRARSFGTCWDHFSVIFQFPGNRVVTFNSKQLGHGYDDIMCRIYGAEGTADTHYFGRVTLSAKQDGFHGGTPDLYQAGAVANIAAFCDAVRKGDCANATVPESVRSNLTTILGRTAAYARREVTWREMMSEAERWEFDLSGLKG